MRKQSLDLFRLVIGTLDIFTLNIIFLIYIFLFDFQIPEEFESNYARFWAISNVSWLLSSSAYGVYKEVRFASFDSLSRSSFRGLLLWIGIISLYLVFFKQYELSRLFVFVVGITFSIMILVNRFIYLLISEYLKRKNHLTKRILILGYNEVSKKLITYLEEESLDTEIVGFCAEDGTVNELSNYPIVGSVRKAISKCIDLKVNEIYSTLSPEQQPIVYNLMQEAEQQCIRFKIIPDLAYFFKGAVHVNYIKDMPVLSLRSEPLDQVQNRIKKRVFDILFSGFVILLVLSWLIPLLALIIKIESKGPIFFLQQRSGKNNRVFRCIKLRTMRISVDANEKQASKNDSRLTRFGRFLRKVSLDEMPQFINVFFGDMSIVGPRPHMLKHTNDYSQHIRKYMVRQFLKPGITGWAQINGYRGETKTLYQMQQRVEHDLWYMENWNFWLDVRIIFLTIYNLCRGEENAW